ncbi:MAG: putative entry exclusion protein TrbK-alt [Aliidongia sp.]
MIARPFKIAAIARTIGFLAVAAAIVATALQFRREDSGAAASVSTPSATSDPLARELARCQAISMAAKDDAACTAAWAENRRRFFTYRPADDTANAATTGQKPSAKPEEK